MSVIGKYFDLDTDSTLGGVNASDYVIASQKAVKTYLASVLPMPTAADEGKMLQVNASGQYELVTIVNSELQPY